MWVAITFASLFAATVVASIMFCRRQQRQIVELARSREKIALEEARVFDFLHGLGNALSDTSRPSDLHVLIVEGALRILNGKGGALYLADRDQLRPTFISRACAPFFEVPANVLAQSGKGTGVLHNFIRMHAVRQGDGVIGSVWRDGEALLLQGEDARLEPARRRDLDTGSAMFAPLLYGGQNLGVLLITRGLSATKEDNFVPADFHTFKVIAEQAAFALSTAYIFSEAAEKKRLDQDLQVAHEIQRILLPASSPDLPGYQISGLNIPARQVSGDYYDYITIAPDRCGVVIADVSGKGIPASLIMAMCRSVLRSQAPGQLSPAGVLRQVNEQLFPDIKEDMFISMAYAILERDSPVITLCRAGHDAPLLYRAAERTVERINPPGMALGIDNGGVFSRVTGDFTLRLEADDCLILYTDGVTEALNADGDEFGMERLVASIRASAPDGAAGVITRLTDDVRTFVGTQPQHDDITLIVIRKK